MVIYKYPLNLNSDGEFSILLPIGARILSVQVQRDVPCMWALVDDTANPQISEPRKFTFITTGEHISNPLMQYIATVQSPDQSVVLHLFEVLE